MGSWKGRGNQYIQFVRVLYCKLPTNSKQLPAFPLEAVPGIEPRPQRWEARVLPLCHCGPFQGLRVMFTESVRIGRYFLSCRGYDFTNPPRLFYLTTAPPTWKPACPSPLPVLSYHETGLSMSLKSYTALFQTISSVM